MALTKATLIDLNANELILDLDADTSITADSDDTIHFKIGGSDEITMTAAGLSPASSDGNALGTASLEWSDLFLADGAVINFGDDQDVSLTHVADTGLLLSSTDQLQFGDSGTYIHQSADGVLDLVSDTEIEINATTIDVNGNLDVSGTIVSGGTLTATTSIGIGSAVLTEAEMETLDGVTAGTAIASKVVTTDANIDTTGQRNLTITGELDAATGDFSGDVDIDGTANLDTVDIDGATQIDATVTVGVDDTGYDVKFFGATSGAYMLWDESTDDLVLAGAAKLYLYDAAGGEHISSDGTDLTLAAGADLNLTATTDINIPANVGLTFGNDAEKIEGDGTDLTISGNNINLTATADVNIPSGVGLTFATGEKLESDGTDLTITVGSGGDINIGTDIGLTFGNDGEKIEGDGTDLTISGNNINLTAVADVNIPSGVGLTFATAEKIESDGTDLSITVGSGGDINIPANIGLTFGDDGEKIEGDGTDLTIAGNNINLTATADVNIPSGVGLTFATAEKIESDGTDLSITVGSNGDINIPANIGLTFGDDGEKIEGDGTDLTIAGNNINLTATADVVIPANVGITFGTGEKIEGDSTDLTVTSGAKINLTATSDVHIPNNVGIVFGGDSEKIEGDGTDMTISSNNLTIDAAADITIDADGADIHLADGGTTFGTFTNSSSDFVIDAAVQDKDIIFKGDDGGSAITALTLDMSAAGQATFNSTVLAKTDTDTSNTGNVTLDFAANQNFVLTLTGNTTLVNPSTESVGQSGFIAFIQDGTGNRTVSLGTDYETAASAGLTLTSTASATDLVPYLVVAANRILLGTPQLAFG